jgi:hypothetical protein
MKRIISILPTFALLLVFCLPSFAFDTAFSVKVTGTVDTITQCEGRDTFVLDWMLMANNPDMTLKNTQSICLTFDNTVLQLAKWNSTEAIPDATMAVEDISSPTLGVSRVSGNYKDFEDYNVPMRVYVAKSNDGNKGYLNLTMGSDVGSTLWPQGVYTSLGQIRFVFREGKTEDDLTPDSVRMMTLAEMNLMNQSNGTLNTASENGGPEIAYVYLVQAGGILLDEGNIEPPEIVYPNSAGGSKQAALTTNRKEAAATQPAAKNIVQIPGMQGLELQVDFTDELYNGGVYYNVTLANENDREFYIPNIFANDVPRKTILNGADGSKTPISELPLVLKPGESIASYYFKYATSAPYQDPSGKWMLFDSYYTVGETYGLQITLTPRPVSYVLDDTIIVTGVFESFNPNAAATVRLMQGSTEAYGNIIGGTDVFDRVKQSFLFEGVAPGTYTLVVTKPGHTSYTVENVVVGDESLDLTQDSRGGARLMSLRCGDINGDNMINNADLASLWMSANYNRNITQAAEPLCDLNGDGMINSADLAILWMGTNYNQGAVVVP